MSDIADSLSFGMQHASESYAQNAFGCNISDIQKRRNEDKFACKLQWTRALIRNAVAIGGTEELIKAYVMLNMLEQCTTYDHTLSELAATLQSAWMAVFLSSR